MRGGVRSSHLEGLCSGEMAAAVRLTQGSVGASAGCVLVALQRSDAVTDGALREQLAVGRSFTVSAEKEI